MKKFTLIEVLVVVAIIGILASLLMPNLKSAREKAISADCQNRLRQMHTAEFMWGTDNNGFMVPTSKDYQWPGPLSTYLGYEQNGHGPDIGVANKNESSINPFMCPKAKANTLSPWTKYAYNGFSGRYTNGALHNNQTKYDDVKRTNVSKPSRALMFMDAKWYYFATNKRWDSNGDEYLHNSGERNTIFVDGHSRANVTFEQQIKDPSDPNYHITWAYGSGN